MPTDCPSELMEIIITRLVQDQKVGEAIEAMTVEDYDQLEDDLYEIISKWKAAYEIRTKTH